LAALSGQIMLARQASELGEAFPALVVGQICHRDRFEQLDEQWAFSVCAVAIGGTSNARIGAP
jgi:hypothetical protein